MTLFAGLSAMRLVRLGIFLVVFAALAFVAAKDAAVATFRTTAPTRVLAMGVKDGQVLARMYIAKLAATELKQPLADSERRDLIQSLSGGPLNRRVLRNLALDSEIRNDDERARRLMRLASRVSRRDIATQLWLVNDAVRREDLNGVLTHYDAALSTRNQAYEVLLPTMTQALIHPQFRAELIPLLRAERPWVESFISYAVTYAPTVGPMATLIEEAGELPNEDELRPMLSHLLYKLVEEGQISEARRFAVAVLEADPEVLKLPGLTEATVDPAFDPLTWSLNEGADLTAYLSDDGQIEIRVTSDRWQPAAWRVFEGDPGRYELAFSSISPRGSASASSRLTATCVRRGGQLALFEKDFEALSNANTWRQQFSLPAGCVGLRIDLSAKSERLGSDAVAIIRDFRLARSDD
jgi:hypothetical protein